MVLILHVGQRDPGRLIAEGLQALCQWWGIIRANKSLIIPLHCYYYYYHCSLAPLSSICGVCRNQKTKRCPLPQRVFHLFLGKEVVPHWGEVGNTKQGQITWPTSALGARNQVAWERTEDEQPFFLEKVLNKCVKSAMFWEFHFSFSRGKFLWDQMEKKRRWYNMEVWEKAWSLPLKK